MAGTLKTAASQCATQGLAWVAALGIACQRMKSFVDTDQSAEYWRSLYSREVAKKVTLQSEVRHLEGVIEELREAANEMIRDASAS